MKGRLNERMQQRHVTKVCSVTCGLVVMQKTATLALCNSDDDDDGDLFEPKPRGSAMEADASNPDALDAPDSSRVPLDDSLLLKWSEPGAAQKLRNRFVTGKI